MLCLYSCLNDVRCCLSLITCFPDFCGRFPGIVLLAEAENQTRSVLGTYMDCEITVIALDYTSVGKFGCSCIRCESLEVLSSSLVARCLVQESRFKGRPPNTQTALPRTNFCMPRLA